MKTDFADKDWLRPKPPQPPSWSVIVGLCIAALVLLVIGWACAYAAPATVLRLLEDSGNPATLGECQRAYPSLGRPTGCVSLQNGEQTPWHHRVCIYK